MRDRCALVTGASRGIGRAVAVALAQRGWRVVLVARDEHALQQTCRALDRDGHRVLALDVGDEAAWVRHASAFGEVCGVVCAAASLGPIGPLGSYLPSEFLQTIQTNVMGTLLAIASCLPGLRAHHGSVVTFSGGGATGPLPRFDAYATSKAAVVRLTENLADELEDVCVNCVAPGFVATSMHEQTLAAGPELVGRDYYERTRRELDHGGASAQQAAELVCLLLENEHRPRFTGKLISAQWDAWREAGFLERLASERDLATLRRIDDMFYGSLARGVDS